MTQYVRPIRPHQKPLELRWLYLATDLTGQTGSQWLVSSGGNEFHHYPILWGTWSQKLSTNFRQGERAFFKGSLVMIRKNWFLLLGEIEFNFSTILSEQSSLIATVVASQVSNSNLWTPRRAPHKGLLRFSKCFPIKRRAIVIGEFTAKPLLQKKKCHFCSRWLSHS